MKDYIDLGSAPAEEDCVQVSPNVDYLPAMRAECIRFIELIRRTLGEEPDGAQFRIMSNPHDFGLYYSVTVAFEDNNEEAMKYACRCEDEAPTRWGQPSTDGKQPAPRVCDSCLTAAYDEGARGREEQAMLMLELGADLADHLCDAVEAPSVVTSCACACRGRG